MEEINKNEKAGYNEILNKIEPVAMGMFENNIKMRIYRSYLSQKIITITSNCLKLYINMRSLRGKMKYMYLVLTK